MRPRLRLASIAGCLTLLALVPAARAGAQIVELSLGPTYARAESLGLFDVAFVVEVDDPVISELTLVMSMPLEIDRGWGASPSVTLHSGRWLSHEISYGYAQADLIFDLSRVDYALFVGDTLLVDDSTRAADPFVERLVVRDVGHAFVANLRPRGSRIQPYAAVGPRLVAYRFKHGHRTGGSFFRRVGLGTVGSVVSGIRAARTSPLDGGTIYRWGVGYGGGIRVRLTRTLGAKLDLRQTHISSPDFAAGAEPEDLFGAGTPSAVAQEKGVVRRFQVTLGATLTF